ncbi:DUF262 domain-containing protein [Parvibaculum sp.]|uniref:DUF262 domain-containing protein n=1 Tax=Parvibaculum sp. TaxID=2024848 RepID=UPI00272F09F2|nr:DUF262 domain-containing protein [Parvibaculum sp.]MDP2151710.1 DUF262 domain-containing protein [Parvibaculum sp.]MDP3328272.1 DUF262 domain-containing protein [Parvibaculum sp.]
MSEEIAELDDPDFTEDDYNESPPGDIVAYNELRSCADLYRMHEDGILEIQPEFQRDFVWKAADQTRFIDSLIKSLPIPSMCFALDYKTDKWIVIDGLQRMSTIVRFLRGDDWRLSKIEDINKDIAGKSAASIKNSKKGTLRSFFTRVQNQSLPINVLRCDFSKKSHMEYLFTIFHRLNAGGVKLNNQEIRNCIYGGSFNELLQELDQHAGWRKINRMRSNENYRYVKQEIILRFFAFHERRHKYSGQIARFLNDYMYSHRDADENFIAEKKHLFDRTVSVFSEKIFPDGPEGRIPTSVLEASLVAVATNIDFVETLDIKEAQDRYEKLRKNDQFTDEAVAEGLSKKDKVDARFKVAQEIFSSAA